MLTSPAGDEPAPGPSFPDDALIEEMERIPDPAVLYTRGGRIAAVNRAAARLSITPDVVGMTVGGLAERYGAYRADGSRLILGDLPCARALRGEIVDLGERIDMNLPDGSVYHALVTSAPIMVDGKVVAALSVWHDFDRFLQELEPSGPGGEQDDQR